MAIRNLWGKTPLPTTNQVHQVTPGISILKDETKTQPTIETRLPQPSPYHTWVVRGRGRLLAGQEERPEVKPLPIRPYQTRPRGTQQNWLPCLFQNRGNHEAAEGKRDITDVRREKVLVFSGCNSHPATGSLQPVAIGAAVEVTKPSEPSRQMCRLGDAASRQAVTRVNVEQASKRPMWSPTLHQYGEGRRRWGSECNHETHEGGKSKRG